MYLKQIWKIDPLGFINYHLSINYNLYLQTTNYSFKSIVYEWLSEETIIVYKSWYVSYWKEGYILFCLIDKRELLFQSNLAIHMWNLKKSWSWSRIFFSATFPVRDLCIWWSPCLGLAQAWACCRRHLPTQPARLCLACALLWILWPLWLCTQSLVGGGVRASECRVMLTAVSAGTRVGSVRGLC